MTGRGCAGRRAAVLTGAALLVVGGGAGAAGTTGQRTEARIALRHALPPVVRIGEEITVAGRVRGAPPGVRVRLADSRGQSWRVLVAGAVGRTGRFRLHWQVPSRTAIGPLKLRVAAVTRSGRRLAVTPAVESTVGSASVSCNPPVPTGALIPLGDGTIIGGRYDEGGPSPGVVRCSSVDYTVTATDSSGAVAASESVPALGSYRLVVPPGHYELTSGSCHGAATVAAGMQTTANTYCSVR